MSRGRIENRNFLRGGGIEKRIVTDRGKRGERKKNFLGVDGYRGFCVGERGSRIEGIGIFLGVEAYRETRRGSE